MEYSICSNPGRMAERKRTIFRATTSNATFTANYTPMSADVQIVKTGALSTGKITYTLQVKNNGPAQAQGVVVKDILPNKVQYASVSTTQGACTGVSTVTCQVGTMNNSQVVTITLVVNVTKAAGFISNTATVSVGSSSPDLNTGEQFLYRAAEGSLS